MAIFGLFELLFFIAQKGVFSFFEYRKTHFPCRYCLKKEVEKMAIFGPKPWVNPFGKMSIFPLFDLLVFIVQKGIFFCSRISQKTFSWPILPKKRIGKMAIFVPKPWVNPFGKIAIFCLFKLFFKAQKGVFFVLEYRKTHFRGLFWKKKRSCQKTHFCQKTMG